MICILLSLCGGILKLILTATGRENAAKVLQTVLGLLILSLAVETLSGETLPSVTLFDTAEEGYYQQLQEETYAEVFAVSEQELGTALCEELRLKFGEEPRACTVHIDRETLSLAEIKIYYASSVVISTYAIKNYIHTAYGVSAEVILE